MRLTRAICWPIQRMLMLALPTLDRPTDYGLSCLQEDAMSDYPSLNTQVIGQAESALGALLEPLLAGAGITFQQWLVLTVTAASGGRADRGQLVARISGARKVEGTA